MFAVDLGINHLLGSIKKHGGDEVDFALDGLKQVMTVKSRVVMPFLVPRVSITFTSWRVKLIVSIVVVQLTAHPVNTKALALLSSVAGDALTRHLSTILPALLRALSKLADDESSDEVYGSIPLYLCDFHAVCVRVCQELKASKTLVLSVTSEAGVRCVIDELMTAGKNPNAGIRKVFEPISSSAEPHGNYC